MKKLLLLTIALALASPCMAQTIAPSSYVGGLTSTDGLNWDPLTSTLTTGPIAPNTYGGLLGYNSSTLQWYPCSVASPCLGAGGGGGGGGPVLETNGVANASQTLLNLIQGTNITLTNSGGGVTINSTAGGATFPSSPSSALFTYTSTTAGRASTAADIGTILKTVESPSYATIELAVAACGGTFPCQINLSSALTQSTSGTYAPPAGVVIAGQAGGSITPGSGNTLDLSNAPFSGPPVAFFTGAGTIVGMRGATPVEWFGAASPYTSITAAAAGPDDSAKFQATINSITQGGWAQIRCGYYHSNNVVITQNNPVNGIKGDCPGYSYPSASQASVIVSTSASADIIHIEGTSSVYAQWETVENLSTQRAVLPTGTSTGVWASFAGGLTVRNVQSQDSIQLFYSHATPGESKGVWENIGGGWGHSIVSGYTTQTVTGINLDSLDGNAENSIFLNNVGFDCSPISSTSVTSTDMLIKGTHINDVDVTYAGGAGCSYGLHIDYTGTGGLDETADIHIDKPLYDECLISCLLFENISSGGSGSVSVNNGYLEESGGSGVRIVDLENSSGISITGSQIFNIVGSSNAQVGIYANGSNFLTLSNNTLQNLAPGTGIQLNATTGSSVTGNTFLGTSSFVMANGISLTSTSIGNSISGNSASGNITTAYVFDGTSLANDFGLNSCSGGSIGTCVSGIPTGTAPSFLGAGSRVNGVTLSSTGSAASYLSQAGTYTPVTFDQIGSGTNLGHGLVCGAGCVISGTGGGFINANEINGTLMSGLATGILKNTTSTGVPSIAVAADFPTLNQSTTGQSGTVNTIAGNVSFGSGLSTSGAGTLASPYVVTSSAGGGSVTNIATTGPISGGPITTTGTISCPTCVTSAASLTASALVLGAGSQATSVLGSLGTTTTVLHGNASGAPSFGAVVLTTDVSGNLPNANLATQTANTVLGALTATTPSGLAVPSCSGATNALTWTSGTGFGCNTISAGTGTVTSFSAGTLSPLFTTSVATATTTPALSFVLTNAAANTVFGNPTGSSAAPSYTSAPSVVTLTTSTSVTSPLFLSGTPAITDTGIWMQATGNTNSYYQASLQNTNAGTTASTDLVINNDQATATTHFIDMGINSSGFTGTGSLNIAGAGYLYTNTGDFVLGTSTANAIHFVYNSGTTDTMLVNANGVSFPTITTTASTAPACFNGTLGSITNVGCAAGATTLAGLAAGLAPSSSGTYDFNNNAITTTGIITGNSVTSGNYRTPNGSTSLNFAVMSGGNWTANNPFITVTAPVVPSSLAATPSQVATSGTFSNTGTTTGSWVGVSLGNTFGASTSNVYNGSAPIQQLRLSPTINVATTSTTGYAALMVNVTETSISAGATNYLTRLQQGGADRFTVTNTGFANAVQLNSTLGSGTVTNTPATGVTSVTCQTATCNVNGGTYTVVGGTATTGTFVTLAWPTTTTAWRCTTNMNGGGTFLGLGHSVATATGMTVSSAVTIISTTFTFDYSCQP